MWAHAIVQCAPALVTPSVRGRSAWLVVPSDDHLTVCLHLVQSELCPIVHSLCALCPTCASQSCNMASSDFMLCGLVFLLSYSSLGGLTFKCHGSLSLSLSLCSFLWRNQVLKSRLNWASVLCLLVSRLTQVTFALWCNLTCRSLIVSSLAVHLRVHTHDKKCCRLHKRLDSTAMEILQEACTKLELNAEEHELCEIHSTGGLWQWSVTKYLYMWVWYDLFFTDKTVFKPTDLSITTEMSVNGRLYALPCGWTEPIVSVWLAVCSPSLTTTHVNLVTLLWCYSVLPRLPFQTRYHDHRSHFLRMRAPGTLLASCAFTTGTCSTTYSRWSSSQRSPATLMFLIEGLMRLAFVGFVNCWIGPAGWCDAGQRHSLSSSIYLCVCMWFSQVQYWVITEICNEPNLQKRAKILTKCIKISS